MAFLSSMNISASGMTAQRLRLDIIAENITNINTTRTESGGPYCRKTVVFTQKSSGTFAKLIGSKLKKSEGGVIATEIIDDQTPMKSVYDPEHPDADESGYVLMPNVDLTKETIDAMAATRAYEANITAFNAVKQMASKALEIGK